ncbi:hypothetical protein DL98DRAFT_606111 [Cadophora sp. DSE1049]|nr:hypothetical protein DL98DRAFT_606111 [Cadophora sp. DSE1049]
MKSKSFADVRGKRHTNLGDRLRSDLEKTLRNCEMHWADKVVKIELKNPVMSHLDPGMPAVYGELIVGAIKTFKLMQSGEVARKERLQIALGPSGRAGPTAVQRKKLQALEDRVKRWTTLVQDMQYVRETTFWKSSLDSWKWTRSSGRRGLKRWN